MTNSKEPFKQSTAYKPPQEGAPSHMSKEKGTFAVPTEEGLAPLEDALKEIMSTGKWTMISPNGGAWIADSPRSLFIILTNEVKGDITRFTGE